MVLYRERDNERPPLSLILPHLFLGAESDVTQDCLSARGISYVLSVSRCSPQPTFLPLSQYLRIPIDDSLRDDLLCWIPEALRFIDGAVSSGGSVLVHCAAGISRSPALAVAYIMYSLGMDLDHAYRFVKERRPSISPNFNFLGQLQHFQGTLSQKTPHSSTLPLTTLDKHLQPASKNTNLFSPSQNGNYLGSCGPNDFAAVEKVYGEKNEETGTFSGNSQQELRSPSPQTLSLSGKLRTLTLALNQNQREVQGSFSAATPSALEPATPLPKPTQLHLPTSYNSLSEKRKSLTLSLTPLGSFPPTNQQRISPCNSNHSARHQSACNGNSKTIHRGEMGTEREARRHSNKPLVGVDSEVEGKQKEVGSANVKSAQPAHSSSRNREGRARGKRNTKCAQSARRSETERDRSRETADNQSCCSPSQSGGAVVVDQQPAPESKLALPAAEAKESLAEEQGVLSPLNLTVNKLLGWGERMLLGVLLGPRIKVGQAALPYRC